MKNTINITLALSLFVIPSVSFAQLNTNLDSQVEIFADAESVVDNTIDATANTGITTKSNTNAGINLDTNTNVRLDSQTNSETNTESNTNLDSMIKVDGDTSPITITSSAQVQSENDLEIFTKNHLQKNKNITEVQVANNVNQENNISVTYRHDAKLFGFIPTKVNSKTSVKAQADGSVKTDVAISWWAFFTTGKTVDRSKLQSNIEGNTRIKNNISANASAQAQAEIVEAITAEIEAHISTKIDA